VERHQDQQLNGPIAPNLPGENIILGYNDNSALTAVEVLKRALESFSVEYTDALAAANRSLDRMPPATSTPRLCGRRLWRASHAMAAGTRHVIAPTPDGACTKACRGVRTTSTP
jgi:hypothetical protein